MLNIKWLLCEIPIGLGKLGSLMASDQYSDEKESGFYLSANSNEKLVGKFIEKTVNRSIIQDPFGGNSEIAFTSYYICNFNLVAKSKYVYLIDPPRSLRKFVNKLHELVGLGLVFSEIEVDPQLWISRIEHNSTKFLVTKVLCSGIKTSGNSTAKLIIQGSRDVRNDLLNVVGDKQFRLDGMRVEAHGDFSSFTGEITRTGTSKIKALNTPVVLEQLRDSLSVIQTQ